MGIVETYIWKNSKLILKAKKNQLWKKTYIFLGCSQKRNQLRKQKWILLIQNHDNWKSALLIFLSKSWTFPFVTYLINFPNDQS